MTWKMLSYHRQVSQAAFVEARNISPGHLANPEGVPPKCTHTEITRTLFNRGFQNIQGRAKYEIDTHRGKFTPHHGAYLVC